MRYTLLISSLLFLPLVADFQTGFSYLQKRNKQASIKAFEDELLKPKPDLRALYYLAKIYEVSYEPTFALAYAESYVCHNPQAPHGYKLSGSIYNKMGCFDQALRAFEKVNELDPNDGANNIEMLKNYLRNGSFEKASNIIGKHTYWCNNYALSGKRVLLELDAPGHGLGDQLMFLHYARYLKQAGAYVIVKAKKFLKPLLLTANYIDEVIYDHTPEVDHIFQNNIGLLMIIMQQLPHVTEPYLKADEQLVRTWEQKLASDHNFKVGLFWQGTCVMDYFSQKRIPGPRGVPVDELAHLTDLPNVSFYALQTIFTIDPLQKVLDANIIFLGSDIDKEHGSFMDTAAIINNLDLVISSDSSVAHLAGALGAPVWLLLSIESDYRWLRNKDTTFWYPSMRIYRSKDIKSWLPLLNEVKDDLQECATQK